LHLFTTYLSIFIYLYLSLSIFIYLYLSLGVALRDYFNANILGCLLSHKLHIK